MSIDWSMSIPKKCMGQRRLQNRMQRDVFLNNWRAESNRDQIFLSRSGHRAHSSLWISIAPPTDQIVESFLEIVRMLFSIHMLLCWEQWTLHLVELKTQGNFINYTTVNRNCLKKWQVHRVVPVYDAHYWLPVDSESFSRDLKTSPSRCVIIQNFKTIKCLQSGLESTRTR